MQRRGFVMAGLASGLALRAGASAAGTRFRVPPEEAPHEMTVMQWPVSREVHPDAGFLDLLQGTIADIANAISGHEPVVMLAASAQHAAARKVLSGEVQLWDGPRGWALRCCHRLCRARRVRWNRTATAF